MTSNEPQDEIESPAQSTVSKPVLLAVAAIALVTFAALTFVFLSRDDDEATPAVSGDLDQLDLAAPLPGDISKVVRLIVEPVRSGENELTLYLAERDGGPDAPPIPVSDMQATLIPLAGDDDVQEIALESAGDGRYAAADPIDLSDGWWQVSTTVQAEAGEAASIAFYLLVPDPNVNGFDAVPEAESDGEAEDLFASAIARWESMRSLAYTERLASGVGTVAISQRVVTDGSDGNPAGSRLVSPQFELITIGDRTWQRTPGTDWVERTTISIYPPSEWPALYDGATDFSRGKTIDLNGRETHIIHFHVPATETLVAAWYTWWIDADSNYVVREAMISTLHYMVYEFGEFDQPVELTPPIEDATPVASPASSPVLIGSSSPVAGG
jgi:hypothetical protein